MLRNLQTIQLKSFALAAFIYVILQLGNWLGIAIPLPDYGTLAALIDPLNQVPIIPFLFKGLLIFIGALILQNSVISNEVIYKNTALVFFFYLILNSLVPSFSYVSSFSILSFICILIFSQIVNFYGDPNPNYTLFKASILVGIGSIIHLSFTPAILILVFAYTRFIPTTLRSIILLLLGFLFPWIVVVSVTYLHPALLNTYGILPPTLTESNYTYPYFIVFTITTLLVVGSTFVWALNSQRNTVKTRRIIQSIIFIIFLLSILSLFNVPNSIYALELVTMPASLVLAYYFSSSKRKRLRNFLLFALLISILFLQYKEVLML